MPPGPSPPETPATRSRLPLPLVVASLLAGTVGLVLASALVGGSWIAPSVVYAILVHQGTGGLVGSACGPVTASSTACAIATEIVWDARLPGVAVALFAGAALAVSGGTLQGVLRNPLADPFLLGLSTGAATGTAILFAFGLLLAQQAVALPLFAFGGALVPGLVVYAASRGPWRSSETLILTGVALSALFSAVLATLLFYNPTGGLQVSFWLLGSLEGETWGRAGILGGALLALGAVIVVHGREVNVLQLGPEVATSVGVEAGAVTRRMVLLTTLLTAVAVAFTGVIGFVGLVSPHIVRRLVGPDYRKVLPLSAAFGGIFLLGAWDVAQLLLGGLLAAGSALRGDWSGAGRLASTVYVVVPVGIPTAFVGGPFFLYLLYRRRGTSG